MRFTTTKIPRPSRNHTVLAVMGLLASVAACSGSDNAATPASGGESAPQFALTVSGLPACGSTRDGLVYFVSSDSNFYVCRNSSGTWAWVQTNLNGLNGASRVTAISPGSQCPTGGYSIQFGLDQNRNGTLDTSEVTSTTVVCNGATGATGAQGATGATGATGQNGKSSLIATVPEPAGTNCANGGVAVQTGLDTNGDGTLEPGEVQHTVYVCNGTSAGCGAGSHDNGSGNCVPTACATGYHHGGDGACVPTGTCSEGYHNDGTGVCVQAGCGLGFHDGGGACVANGTCVAGDHDNGEGICVQAGCAAGFHDGGGGACAANGTCVAGYHDNGYGSCVVTFMSVSAGGFHTCGLEAGGTIVCWGYNGDNQATPPAASFTSVSAGDLHTCGAKTDGSIACWGDDDDGQATPPAGSFTSVSAGNYHTCGVKTDGSIACWGLNGNNQATPPAI